MLNRIVRIYIGVRIIISDEIQIFFLIFPERRLCLQWLYIRHADRQTKEKTFYSLKQQTCIGGEEEKKKKKYECFISYFRITRRKKKRNSVVIHTQNNDVQTNNSSSWRV